MTDQEIHRQLSADCFNGVWELLEKKNRTPEEDILLCEMAHASLFHWLQRDDLLPDNLSIGYWQVSRVYSILNRGEEALRYAKDCVSVSESAELAPFYRGYAYEALARAAKVLGDEELRASSLKAANQCLAEVETDSDAQVLKADLKSLSD